MNHTLPNCITHRATSPLRDTMDCFSCIALLFNDHTPAERKELKEVILKAIEQVHIDYVHNLTEKTVTHYYKYNGPSTYNSVMTNVSKLRILAAHKPVLKVLTNMYDVIGLHGFAGIIIQYDNTSIVVNNNSNIRHSVALYCTLNLKKVS